MTQATGAALVALAGCSAFASTAPLAAPRMLPPLVRLAFALALTPAVAARTGQTSCCSMAALVANTLAHALIGAATGLTAAIVASAAVGAGNLVDATLSQNAGSVDGAFGSGSGPFGKLYSLGFTLAWLASGGFTRLVDRFMSVSVSTHPGPPLWLVVDAAQASMNTAVIIAFPALASACFSALAAGMISRFARAVSVMFLVGPSATALMLAASAGAAGWLFVRFVDLGRTTADIVAAVSR